LKPASSKSFVILSAAKDLPFVALRSKQILRFAQDDKFGAQDDKFGLVKLITES